jgi:hypothetical protein
MDDFESDFPILTSNQGEYFNNETGNRYLVRKIITVRSIDPFEILELKTVIYKPISDLKGQYFTREINDFHSKFTLVPDKK